MPSGQAGQESEENSDRIIATGALESDEAREFLAAMPSVEALMPPIEVESLELEPVVRQRLVGRTHDA